VRRAFVQPDARKKAGSILDDQIAIGVDYDFIDFRAIAKRGNYSVVERLTSK
jgi:hypothetical protein